MNTRFFVLFFLLTACSSSPSPSGPSAGTDSAPPGLFGGSGGGAGNGTVTLMDQDAGMALPEDGSVDVGESDGAVEALDAGPDATVVTDDAGSDAGEDAGQIDHQCQPCVTECPSGYTCETHSAEGTFCMAQVASTDPCPEGQRHPFDTWDYCAPITTCAEWLSAQGG